MQSIIPTNPPAPIHRQRHDQDQPFQAIGMLKLRVLQLKATAF
jgi:hypothetical protein